MKCHHQIPLLAVLFLSLMSSPVSGQDSALYRVHVSPFMQLDAMTPNRTAVHPMTAGNVVFTSNRWFARSSSITGSTVRLSTDHAFQHVSNATQKRDARLTLTGMSGSSGAGWHYNVVSDTTNYLAGDDIATVQVSSTAPGNALIMLRVDFITGTVSTMQQGNYELTVVGTISEN